MNNDYNNGLIIGSLLGLAVVKRFEHADVVKIADVFPSANLIAASCLPMDISAVLIHIRPIPVDIGNTEISVLPYNQTLLETEVLP